MLCSMFPCNANMLHVPWFSNRRRPLAPPLQEAPRNPGELYLIPSPPQAQTSPPGITPTHIKVGGLPKICPPPIDQEPNLAS